MKHEHKQLNELKNEWHWGPTGTGKSMHVRSTYPDAYIKGNNIWWDGYAGEKEVIIEEFGPKQVGGHHLKQWADHYEFKAEVKGGSIKIRPERIIITSNFAIEECYEHQQDIEPLKRRFRVHHHSRLDLDKQSE